MTKAEMQEVMEVEEVAPQETNSVWKKILALREKVKGIESSKMNTKGLHYNYLSEAEMTKALRPAMQELGLVMIPQKNYSRTDSHKTYSEETQDGNGVKKTEKFVLLSSVDQEYIIVDTDTGDSVTLTSVGAGSDSMDKGVNKANTGAFKNALRALGMFPSPDRDDPDTTPSTGGGKSYSSDVGSTEIKYGPYAGKTMKDLFDENPEAVEELANGKSKWIASRAQEFLASLK